MTLSVELSHAIGDFALDVAFEAPAGVTALFGRSGAGKSTVIRAIAGHLRPAAGRIVCDERVLFDAKAGVHLSPHRRCVGVIYQDARLFPHLSVAGNLRFARWAGRRPPHEAWERVTALLGLAPLLDRRPAALSGGERQRVAIGRALLSAPALLLLDEPMAALDDARRSEIMPYLERLRDEAGVPMVYVSHRVSEVVRLAARVVVLEEGRSVTAGSPAAVFGGPTASGVREAGAVLEGRITAHDVDDGLSTLALESAPGHDLTLPAIDAPVGARVRVRVRASDVMVALTPPEGLSTRNVLSARVARIASGEGPGALVTLALGGPTGPVLLARLTQRAVRALNLAEGMPVVAVMKAFAVARDDVTIIP